MCKCAIICTGALESLAAFKHAYDFDPVYRDYNPGFKTVSITPMLSIRVFENWDGMLVLSRKF